MTLARCHRLLLVTILCASPGVVWAEPPKAAAPAETIKVLAATETPKVRHVDLKYTCEIADVPAGAKTVDLWIPVPVTNQRQTVRLLNESELGQGRFTNDKKFGNRLYYRHFEAPAAETNATSDKAAAKIPPIKIELRYEAEVREATVEAAKKLVSTKQVPPGPEFAPYLGDVKMIPIKGRITELARKRQSARRRAITRRPPNLRLPGGFDGLQL